jgi:Kef-type K+ transport system membrane component KefB
MTTQLLSLGLKKIRQPRVIAEVIGGIFLGASSSLHAEPQISIARFSGPSICGRIPHFSEHIFPEQSISYLSLVANIGLCLFLFLVGLEIDAAVIRKNARLSVTIAFAGMALPFGLGAALSVPIYHQFIDPSIKFTYFMLFTG